MTSIAEAAEAYEQAKAALVRAREALAVAQATERDAFAAERGAYKQFNEAVEAMRPKRGPRPKKDAADA